VWTLTRRRPDAGEHEGGERGGEAGVLSTIEKVMVLKTVSIFSETPDDVLAEVASLLEEQDVDAGEAVFRKGDLGTAMYVVVEGRVRVHDGERTLRELGERDIFGEMAALDPEPRSASVTALAPTRLFRLDQEDLYELMSDRIEVVRGVIRVLCRRLRATP
jgi:CRP-like cAMP-binding protein